MTAKENRTRYETAVKIFEADGGDVEIASGEELSFRFDERYTFGVELNDATGEITTFFDDDENRLRYSYLHADLDARRTMRRQLAERARAATLRAYPAAETLLGLARAVLEDGFALGEADL